MQKKEIKDENTARNRTFKPHNNETPQHISEHVQNASGSLLPHNTKKEALGPNTKR